MMVSNFSTQSYDGKQLMFFRKQMFFYIFYYVTEKQFVLILGVVHNGKNTFFFRSQVGKSKVLFLQISLLKFICMVLKPIPALRLPTARKVKKYGKYGVSWNMVFLQGGNKYMENYGIFHDFLRKIIGDMGEF